MSVTDRRPPFRFAVRTRVGFDETDAQGIVYYGRYMPYFDRARVEYLRHLDLLRPESGGAEFVMRAQHVEYHAPARFDDELEVFVRVRRAGPDERDVGVRGLQRGNGRAPRDIHPDRGLRRRRAGRCGSTRARARRSSRSTRRSSRERHVPRPGPADRRRQRSVRRDPAPGRRSSARQLRQLLVGGDLLRRGRRAGARAVARAAGHRARQDPGRPGHLRRGGRERRDRDRRRRERRRPLPLVLPLDPVGDRRPDRLRPARGRRDRHRQRRSGRLRRRRPGASWSGWPP